MAPDSDSSRIAIIDVGSNTARLIVMQSQPGFAYRLVDEVREVVRLRQGMGSSGMSEEAMERGLSTLRLFKRFCDSTGVDCILATATSAVRDASNGPQFIERARRMTGLTLRLLSEEEEAYYGVVGAMNETPISAGYVLDIGGGSIQLSRVDDNRFARGVSFPLGALALTERFIGSDSPTTDEMGAVRKEVERCLASVEWLKKPEAGLLTGLGGTIRNLAAISAARRAYPLSTLHGYRLTLRSVKKTIEQLWHLPLRKRQGTAGLSPDRADIILAGALTLQVVMEQLEADELAVSMSGLREGVFLEQFWRHLPYPIIPDPRLFGVLNMARNYGYDKRHANHVRFIAGRLFQRLAPLHGYGNAELELLDAAALLHDIGTVINYDRHHHHSQTLITYNGLPGYEPREIALIALMTRYHRKGAPTIEPFVSILRDDDEQLLLTLSAILRLAEFLERGRNGIVDDVTVTITDDAIRLTLIAEEYPAVELWEAERNAAPLVEEAFQKKVVLESLVAPSSDDVLPDPV
jgi:exopolyphosphatase/guanosine-5'-triphosphate,3'-diphosphate pyrophosphatase